MADKTTSKQVSTTVPGDVYSALEDHRWTARKKMTEVVAEAIQDYLVKHNIQVQGSAEPAQAEEKPNKGK